MTTKETDIIVIGAGPVGLFSVFEAGMLKMKCHVVDVLDAAGGQCVALYPEKPIYDIPAHPKVSGSDLIDNLMEQIKPFNPEFSLGEKVEKLSGESGNFEVKTDKGTKIKAKAIIIAAGCGAFGPHKPPLQNLESFEETGAVQYFVKKMAEFNGKKVAIAGGGDSAIDWVLSLVDLADRVSLIHRRNKFRAAPDSEAKLRELEKQGRVDMVVPYQLDHLNGENGKLESVRVKDLDGNIKDVEADVLLPFYGLSMELGPIADWGLGIENKHIGVDITNMKTNIDGVFAIGDIANYEGKLKLILTGFNEAALACHNIYKIVYPDVPLHFEYSTTKGV